MMSSSQCIVPNWNLRQQQQRQEGDEEGEERNRSSHVQSHQNLTHSYVVPMNNKDVMELTWHNGQLALNDLELNPPPIGDHTLESIVHQATAATNFNARLQPQPMLEPSAGKWDSRNSGSGRMHAEQSAGKRVRRPSEAEESACGSASAAFCRETDATMMTWNSFESPRSLKCARVGDDDSLYQDGSENQEGEGGTKGESCRSQSSARRSRAAAIHNLSERRRRDRINEKMKALQKLVPNASKTDKASMLDEVIEYLKQLQAQVHMMSNARSNMPQMVMPNLGMQQQLQMSLLARMGMGMGMNMGMGMGMLDVGNLARTNLPSASFPPGLMHPANAPFVSQPQPFAMPPMVPHPGTLKASADTGASASVSMPNFGDAYNTLVAQQSMNMEFLNKMSAIYRQQSSQQPSKKPVNDAQGGG